MTSSPASHSHSTPAPFDPKVIELQYTIIYYPALLFVGDFAVLLNKVVALLQCSSSSCICSYNNLTAP